MAKRFNIRVDDALADRVKEIARAVNEAGGDGSISKVARKLIAEGLRSYGGTEELTSNEKGSQFELFVVNALRNALWDGEVEKLSSRPGVILPDVSGPLLDIECKAGRRPSTRQALDQARNATREGKSAVAIIKDDDRESPFVVLEFGTFLAFYRCAYEMLVFAEDVSKRFALERMEDLGDD